MIPTKTNNYFKEHLFGDALLCNEGGVSGAESRNFWTLQRARSRASETFRCSWISSGRAEGQLSCGTDGASGSEEGQRGFRCRAPLV